VAALTLGATVAQPSVQFVNLYQSSTCDYGANSQAITLKNPQDGTYTNVTFSQVGWIGEEEEEEEATDVYSDLVRVRY
jgi:hypothetical protein